MVEKVIGYIAIAIFFGFLVFLVISRLMYRPEPTPEELLRFVREIKKEE